MDFLRKKLSSSHQRHVTESELLSTSAPTTMESTNQESKENVTLNIKNSIGNGAFGVVYIAELGENKEVVAVKKVLQDRRYKNRELQIISELNHPNIVSLKNTFYTTDPKDSTAVYLNLVLEYLPENLHKEIKHQYMRETAIPELKIKLYMYQLCRSLAYLHSLGICHRDIKPQNLLVDPELNILKLCDFGSAKKLVKNEANVSYICSRFYRAPELIFGATEYTTAVDMWAVGCVAAEMVLGTPIFTGENAVDQLVEIIKVLGTPSISEILEMNRNSTDFNFPMVAKVDFSEIFPEASKEMVDFISSLLTYRPSERLDPLTCLKHPFFDELRTPFATLPNGEPLPPLFNFTTQEFSINKSLVESLIPECQRNSSNFPGEKFVDSSVCINRMPHPYSTIFDGLVSSSKSG